MQCIDMNVHHCFTYVMTAQPWSLKPACGTDEVDIQHVADSSNEHEDGCAQNNSVGDDPTRHALQNPPCFGCHCSRCADLASDEFTRDSLACNVMLQSL